MKMQRKYMKVFQMSLVVAGFALKRDIELDHQIISRINAI